MKEEKVKNSNLKINYYFKDIFCFFSIFFLINPFNKLKQIIFILTIIFLYNNNYKLM